MTSPARDPVHGFLARCVAAGRMPGATWWVEGPGGCVSRGALGLAALEPEAVPLAGGTPFDLASLTKPLATALLLVLAEQRGEIDLDAPVESVLEELAGSPYATCTLLSLSAHTAGLPAWRPLYVESTTLEGYLGSISRTPPAVERGKTLYSDLGYVILGAVLARVAGQPLDGLFDERVAKPLGPTRLSYARGGEGFRDAAATERGNAYERAMTGEAGDRHPWRDDVLRGEVHDANAHGLDGVAGHAGLFGTAEDVAMAAREIVRPSGRIALGRGARARLLEPVDGSEGRTVGCVTAAFARAARGILPGSAPGHTGFTGTSLWLDPLAGAVFVLLTNRVHPRVGPADFALVRRGFHRLARQLV